jgi:hypothetical protein
MDESSIASYVAFPGRRTHRFSISLNDESKTLDLQEISVRIVESRCTVLFKLCVWKMERRFHRPGRVYRIQ